MKVTILVRHLLPSLFVVYALMNALQEVDLESSFLSGHLCMYGLVEAFPEITTYFEAEIIGSHYGFLTQNWGATEAEDLIHWSRLPAFKQIKNDLKKPYLTIGDSIIDTKCEAVFMRWKEKFLVPDHAQDLQGASFAGWSTPLTLYTYVFFST